MWLVAMRNSMSYLGSHNDHQECWPVALMGEDTYRCTPVNTIGMNSLSYLCDVTHSILCEVDAEQNGRQLEPDRRSVSVRRDS